VTPRSIADYELVRPLGYGVHGAVFLALRPLRLPVQEEFLAVKILSCESTAVSYRRATRRLRAYAAVASPHLVPLYDAGQHDGIYYCSMEYAADGSLASHDSIVDTKHGLMALAGAARGLVALHEAGLTHGAVQPGNVLIRNGGGAARMAGILAEPALGPVFTPGLVYSGHGSATVLEYAEPTVLAGAVASAATDVWAIGVLAHRLLAGSGVYGELPPDDGSAALRRVLTTKPFISPTLPQRAADLVRGCLAPAPRRLTAAEASARLDLLVNS
jgi:serine/threonine protein kinase